MLDYGLMFEQLPPMVAISLLAHECTIARIWCRDARRANRERFLPDLIAGRKICCTGTTEPDVGSDPRSVKTRVVADGDELVINGRKMWITNVTDLRRDERDRAPKAPNARGSVRNCGA